MCSKAATKADRLEKSAKNTLRKILKITRFYLVSYSRIQPIYGNIVIAGLTIYGGIRHKDYCCQLKFAVVI